VYANWSPGKVCDTTRLRLPKSFVSKPDGRLANTESRFHDERIWSWRPRELKSALGAG
jgi:hypothetical protein